MRVFVSRLLGLETRYDPYVECRRCGTTLSAPTAGCPNCGSTRSVTYEVD